MVRVSGQCHPIASVVFPPARSGARALGILTAGNYGAIAISFSINLVLTRAIGPGEFGRLALLLVASQILLFLVAHWSYSTVIQFGAREIVRSGALRQTFWVRMFWLGIGAAIVGPLLLLLGTPVAEVLAVPRPWLALLFLHFFAVAIFTTAAAVLQAAERMSEYGALLFLERIAAIVFVAVMLAIGWRDALGAFVALTLSNAALAAWGFWLLHRVLTPVGFSRTHMAEMLRFSIPLVASTWMGFLGTQWIDLVVIRAYLPLGALGLYSLAGQLAGAMQQLTVIAGSYVLPRYSVLASEGREDAIRAALTEIVPVWLLAFGFILQVGIIAAPIVVPLIFGDAFAGAATPFALLLVAGAWLAVFATFNPVLLAHGETVFVSIAVLASVVANVALDLMLVPPLGIAGAAIATVLAYAVSALIVLARASRRSRIPALPYVLFPVPVAAVYAAVAVDAPWSMPGALAITFGSTLGLALLFGIRDPRRALTGEGRAAMGL